MSVYVDDFYKSPMGQYGRMKMSHMVADTLSELRAMARMIGVQEKWIQYPENPNRCHFDICMSKRRLAIQKGAIPISCKELAHKTVDLNA